MNQTGRSFWQYMVIGGVPYYMDRFRPDKTMADNINTIYFNKDKARQEFKDVYAGLYSTSEVYSPIGVPR